MRLPNDPSKLFGHYDVIDALERELAEELAKVHNPVCFDSPEVYMERLRVDIPRLGEPRTKKTGEGAFPAGGEAFSRRCSPDTPIPGYSFTLEIPFDGDGRVFEHTPSHWFPSGRQEGRIEDGFISAEFYVLKSKPETVAARVTEERREIEKRIGQWLDKAVADFEGWNARLGELVEGAIAARRREIVEDGEVRRAINEATAKA